MQHQILDNGWSSLPPTILPMLRLISLFGLAHAFGLTLHLGSSGSGLMGEVISGFILGPNSQNLVPEEFQEGLKILGLIGLFLTAFEDGLYTDFSFFPYVTLPSLFVGILAPAFSMGLGVLALYAVGIPWVEAACACAALATAVPGRARVRWTRTTWQTSGAMRDQVGQVISLSAFTATILGLTGVAVCKGLAANGYMGNTGAWGIWDLLQPTIVSLGVVAISLALRTLLAWADADDYLSDAAGNTERRGIGGFWVFGMCCVLIGFIIFAEELRSVSILGAYCAGVVFSGVSGGRLSWEHNTRNLAPWLLRLFFACTVGFTIPYRMWVWKEDALAGFFVGVMAIIGKILGGSLASLPFLGGVDWPLRIAQSLQIGSAMSVHGHIGIFALTQITSRGLISQHSASGAMWGILYGSLLGPIIFEACCQLEIKAADMQNTDPEKDLNLPYPAVPVKELPRVEGAEVTLDSVEIGTAARDMRTNVLKYQRVQEPVPSPYIVDDIPADSSARKSPRSNGVYATPAPYSHIAPNAPSGSAQQYPMTVPTGYSMVTGGTSTYEPPSTIMDRQPYFPQHESP